jgi:aminoglycoside 6'-N-acetyltransferase I
MKIRHGERGDLEEWMRMRSILFPECSREEHVREMEPFLAKAVPLLVAERANGKLAGFLEGGIRSVAEGCWNGPVPYVEAWYVDQDARRRHVGRDLMAAFEAWAREKGYREMASDCVLTNDVSRTAHLALGFEEVERIIQFRKTL